MKKYKDILANMAKWAYDAYLDLNQGKLNADQKAEVDNLVKKVSEQIRLLAIAMKQVKNEPSNIERLAAQARGVAEYLVNVNRKVQANEMTEADYTELRETCNKVAEDLNLVSQKLHQVGLGHRMNKSVLSAFKAWIKGDPTPDQFKNIFR